MKRTISHCLVLLFLLLASGSAPFSKMAAAGDAPRVTRPMLIEAEKVLDPRVSRSGTDSPFLLLGSTRGVYLENYGAVFTAEINLVSVPAAMVMFRPISTKEEISAHRQKRVARLPELRRALRDALADAAASLTALPPDDQVVFVAILAKYQWEDAAGLPLQIRMQASKKQLLEQRKNDEGLAAVIRTVED